MSAQIGEIKDRCRPNGMINQPPPCGRHVMQDAKTDQVGLGVIDSGSVERQFEFQLAYHHQIANNRRAVYRDRSVPIEASHQVNDASSEKEFCDSLMVIKKVMTGGKVAQSVDPQNSVNV